ncbi:hypothetical protein FEM48_Zijuj12G0068700 [Ziziphus jujuba var. spinosa]|uniref:Secreted protein n=1 Tax=Ziziphus jujuba var. spinosa TaxID=714518 RepID=A0A978UBU0_ZIZJJ|nr:hypothetical protein FEM48_Zijuj12G0068700 [Ziziphus jujuba var. spinosa]
MELISSLSFWILLVALPAFHVPLLLDCTHCFFPTFDPYTTKTSSSASGVGKLHLETVSGPPNEIIVHYLGSTTRQPIDNLLRLHNSSTYRQRRYGITGVCTGPETLPSRMSLKRFSYHFPSRDLQTRKQDDYQDKSDSRELS